MGDKDIDLQIRNMSSLNLPISGSTEFDGHSLVFKLFHYAGENPDGYVSFSMSLDKVDITKPDGRIAIKVSLINTDENLTVMEFGLLATTTKSDAALLFPKLVLLSQLKDVSSGFTVDDTVNIHLNCEVLVDTVNFHGFGNYSPAMAAELEVACARHPSLLQSQLIMRRSKEFSWWAFTALGRVLLFLKVTPLIEMDDKNSDHLRFLWSELQMCGFDLGWLVPFYEAVLKIQKSERKRLWKNMKECDEANTQCDAAKKLCDEAKKSISKIRLRSKKE